MFEVLGSKFQKQGTQNFEQGDLLSHFIES
jgi:hypothetical protein